MRALTFHGKRDIRYESVDDPKIAVATDAIVRVEMTAVCGSDMHVYHGRESGLDAGTVMGHEFTGEVVEVGADVRAFRAGDRVFSPFTTSCGACFYCRSELTARCERGQLFGWVEQGQGLHGAQAELVRVPLADSTLVGLGEGISPAEGLLLGDVFSTGYFCARLAGIQPGGVYAIVGCGPVGLMAIVGARELGAERLFAIDRIPERLERAAGFGASVIDLGREDPLARVGEATDGRGADAVLEVVGSPRAGRAAYELVRPGGTIAVVGVHNEPSLSFTPAEAYDKNLTLRVGRCPARSIADTLIPVVQQRKYDLTSIVTHTLALADGPSAYTVFDEKRDGCIKPVLIP